MQVQGSIYTPLPELKSKNDYKIWTIPFHPIFPDINLIEDLPSIVAIDTETTGLNWAKEDCFFSIQAAWYNSQEKLVTAYWCFPVNPHNRQPIYRYDSNSKFYHLKDWLLLDTLLNSEHIIKVFANAKFDMHMLEKMNGIVINGRIDDVLVMAWCCNSLEKPKLKSLAKKYLDFPDDDEKLLKQQVIKARKIAKERGYNIGKSVEQDYWLVAEIFPDDVFNTDENLCETYAVNDAIRTINLYYYYDKGLDVLNRREAYEVEVKLLPILYAMEKKGVRIDDQICIKEIDRLGIEIEKEETFIKQESEIFDLNVSSPKQLQHLLYKKLKLRITQFTTKGQPSTDQEVLKQHKDIPIIDSLLKIKGYDNGQKQYKNYLARCILDDCTLDDFPNLKPKCLHPNFNQIATTTGRLSCSNPNLQNVSDAEKSKAEYPIDTRTAFICREGYRWYCIDFSQIELRIFAYRCGPGMQWYNSFASGVDDPHDETRRAVPYLASMSEATGRKLAKNTNFTIVNCGGPIVLNKKYGIPLTEAKQIHEELYREMPEIKKRQKEAEQFAIQNGFIQTLTNRKIDVDCTRSTEGRYKWTYRATSYDIQGSAADIIKRAMIRVNEYILSTGYDAHLILTIHDELIFEVNKKCAFKSFLRNICNIMEDNSDLIPFSTPVSIEKTNKSWSSKDKVKVKL